MKMRGKADQVVTRNVCYFAAAFVVVSCFVRCTTGSCLSYGHSCWGAHGKRSRPLESSGLDRKLPEPLDERWIFSRLVNRQLLQAPLAAKLRARMMAEQRQQLDDELPNAVANVKHSALAGKFPDDVDIRDVANNKQRIVESELPDVLLVPPEPQAFANERDRAIKMDLYEILKNIDGKL